MSSDGHQQVGYKTHILVGVRASGSMNIICHWPTLPRQSDVLKKIAATHESYDTYLLCTPTSVMPAQSSDASMTGRKSGRPFGFR
jgi:hypothetical protein